jgi:hypothetical protein
MRRPSAVSRHRAMPARDRRLATAALALAVSLGATVAIAQATGIVAGQKARTASTNTTHTGRTTRAKQRPKTVTHAAVPAPQAPRGLAGPQGLPGPAGIAAGEIGPAGPQGPPGVPGIVNQTISINWQDGDYRDRDSASFVAPGIGQGVVTCSLDTQWVDFTPYDQGADSEMWGAIMRGEEVSVRAAARRAPSWGNQFNLGLNRAKDALTEEPESEGSMVGIISSRGAFGSPGESGPPPTTFHLSWYWSFADGYGPRCYVAGTFTTGR